MINLAKNAFAVANVHDVFEKPLSAQTVAKIVGSESFFANFHRRYFIALNASALAPWASLLPHRKVNK